MSVHKFHNCSFSCIPDKEKSFSLLLQVFASFLSWIRKFWRLKRLKLKKSLQQIFEIKLKRFLHLLKHYATKRYLQFSNGGKTFCSFLFGFCPSSYLEEKMWANWYVVLSLCSVKCSRKMLTCYTVLFAFNMFWNEWGKEFDYDCLQRWNTTPSRQPVLV
jgi:hypothetical protein